MQHPNIANPVKVSVTLSVIAILVSAAGLAVSLNAVGSLSNFSSQASELNKKLSALSSQLEAANKNTELIAQATGVPLGSPQQVQELIERRKLIEAAKAEGKVLVYGTLEEPTFRKLEEAYERLYPGVDVQYWRGSGSRLIDKVLTEVKAGNQQFDVVMAGVAPIVVLKKDGIFQRYISPEAKNYPQEAKDPDGILQPYYRAIAIGILYNTKLVKPEEAPKDFLGLLDSKWKGKIVLVDPAQHITIATWFFNAKQILGDKWEPFIRGLSKQDVRLVNSFTPAAEIVARGEKAITISQIKYVATMKAAPLDYVRVSTALGDVHTAGLSGKPRHPNAAKLFIDFLLSVESSKILAHVGEFVLRQGIYPPIKDAEKIKIVSMQELTEEQYKQWGPTLYKWITEG